MISLYIVLFLSSAILGSSLAKFIKDLLDGEFNYPELITSLSSITIDIIIVINIIKHGTIN